MKYFLLLLVVLISGISHSPAQQKFTYSFVAVRNNTPVDFPVGKAVRIVLNNTGGVKKRIVRGYIVHIDKDSISIGSFHKNDMRADNKISPGDISKIMVLSRKGRKADAWLLGGAGAFTGLIFSATNVRTPFSVILFLPAIFAGAFVFYHYPISWAFDFANEKKAKNGWVFRIK